MEGNTIRKIFAFLLTTLDGFFEGPNHDLSWHNVDEEFNHFAVEQTSEVGTFLYGRVTYQMFESYWPNELKNPKISKEDLEIAHLINDTEKLSFQKR